MGKNKDTGFTVQENELLNMLAAGEMDGFFSPKLFLKDGACFWVMIDKGLPALYLEKPTKKAVEDGHVVLTPGISIRIKEWKTEEEKLDFLKNNGEDLDNEAAREYAAQNQEEKNQTEGLIRKWKVYDYFEPSYPLM